MTFPNESIISVEDRSHKDKASLSLVEYCLHKDGQRSHINLFITVFDNILQRVRAISQVNSLITNPAK